jgi:hypothetical protein
MSDNGGENNEVKPEGPQHVALKLQGTGFPELVIKVKRSVLLSHSPMYCFLFKGVD